MHKLSRAVFIAATMLANPASATGFAQLAGYPDFSLRLHGERIDVQFDDEAQGRQLEHYSLGFSVAEPVTEQLRLRLYGGNSGVNIDGRTDFDGRDPSGHFLGIGAEWQIPAGTAWQLEGEATLARHEVSERLSDGDRLELDWNRAALSLGVAFVGAARWQLSAGGYLLAIDGKTQRSGTLNSSSDMEHDSDSGVWTRLKLIVGRSGIVAFDLRGGAQNSFSVTFQRQY